MRAVVGSRRFLGQALHSPSSARSGSASLERREEAWIDAARWRERINAALVRRSGIDATAYRVVHAEGDGLPLADDRPLRPLAAVQP
ncbi:MAG: hypothetical protein R2909_19320 [Gemmatimonadales bacterium]